MKHFKTLHVVKHLSGNQIFEIWLFLELENSFPPFSCVLFSCIYQEVRSIMEICKPLLCGRKVSSLKHAPWLLWPLKTKEIHTQEETTKEKKNWIKNKFLMYWPAGKEISLSFWFILICLGFYLCEFLFFKTSSRGQNMIFFVEELKEEHTFLFFFLGGEHNSSMGLPLFVTVVTLCAYFKLIFFSVWVWLIWW